MYSRFNKQIYSEIYNSPDIKTLAEKEHRIIVLQQGLCDAFFREELENGITHNSNIKVSSNNAITSFR